MFIDKINNIIKIMNRFKKGSFFIYEFANFRTLAEIKRTIEENKRPQGSRIIGK